MGDAICIISKARAIEWLESSQDASERQQHTSDLPQHIALSARTDICLLSAAASEIAGIRKDVDMVLDAR